MRNKTSRLINPIIIFRKAIIVDELIDKIKEQSIQSNNIKPNMNLVEKNKYKEVSDDEFFDDFFD